MNSVFPGRYTANASEPFVVFLIGMRVNRVRSIKKWWPVAQAMGPMMASLSKSPEKGLLGARMFFRGWPLETCMVSYWRSLEDLTHFARRKDDPHFAAWQSFLRSVGDDGSVGIWHETYQVNPTQCESVYVNMPAYGLASAIEHRPLSLKTRTETDRMAENY